MRFGAHVSASGGIDTAIDRVEAIGGECVQVFTQSPRMWKPTNHKPETIARFRERRAEAKIGGVVCHALYLVNLAAPDDVIHRKSIDTLRATLDAGQAIGADAIIFHVGSHLGAGFDVGLERATEGLVELLDGYDGDTWVCMENSAGTGGTIGRSLEELVALLDRAGRHPRLGVCLDSCHLFASGYDVRDAKAVDRLVAEVDAGIGLDRLRALHVNDSATPLGSNRDRHANILEGEIGEGMATFLAHPAFQGLDAYLEVPGVNRSGVNADELRKVRDLHKQGVARAKRRAKRGQTRV